MGKAVARPTRTKAERLMDAKRALDLRLAGVDDYTICRDLGVSKSTLKRWIRWALDQQLDPTVEQYREEAAGRIREARRRIYATLAETRTVEWINPGTGELQVRTEPLCGPADIAALTGRLVQLEEQEAKLRGGYMPVRVDVTHTVKDAFDQLLAEQEHTPPVTRPADATRQGA
jgi:transposase